MLLKKTFLVFAGILAVCVPSLWAGDSASFVDLGFSPDGKTYMFAQYGVQSKSLMPWADLFVVDVARNNFVPDGRISYVHDKPVLAGQDGSGALYRIVAKNSALADKYRLDYLNQGQPLYIDMKGEASDTIEFRDFESGKTYKASLTALVEGSGKDLKSSFFISLESVSADGARRTYTVGTPQIKRPLIESYSIRKVMIAPRDGSMIFVIEMKKQAAGGADTRYMVEALRL